MTRQTAAINVGPGHDRPERARAFLLTGEAGAAPAAHYAKYRPRLDETSRRVIESADRPAAPSADSGPRRLAGHRGRAGNSRHRALAAAMPGPRRWDRRHRTDAHHQLDAHQA